ncbi:MAG: DUF4082 domain-containing protein [Flavobacterium sp.]|nr:DUF4082 domain-containing protein [Flavobacterium sp.]
MKTIFLKAVFFLAVISITLSCSKDDEPAPPNYTEENFLEGYLATTGFSQSNEQVINDDNYEFGIEFTPLVKGKITKLKVNLPATRSDLRITIWDKATTTPIRTETVNYSAANTIMAFDIADLDLVKDKEYAITCNSDDWNFRKRTIATPTTYPVTSGNIKIISYKYLMGTTQSYPSDNDNTYYSGDLSFDFIQTN